MIPILFGIAIVGTSVFGITKARDGVAAMQRAKGIVRGAQNRHRASILRLDAARVTLGGDLERLNVLRADVVERTLTRMVSVLQALDRRGRLRRARPMSIGAASREHLAAFEGAGFQPMALLGGFTTAGLAGGGAAAMVTSLVSSFATASTGAAISGLTGAAAESALLAWLGGGSLATGGLGMAAGALILNGIMVAPALAIGGWVLAAQGERALTQATSFNAEVDVACARIESLIGFHARAQQRVAEIGDLTASLQARAEERIAAVERLIPVFDLDCDEHASSLTTAMMLCRALGELSRAQVIDAEGNVDSHTTSILEGVRRVAGLLQ